MIYEQIVRAWNAQADEHNQYDTLSDRERVEFVLRMKGRQEPCICGYPSAPGVIHRTDGPCYVQESDEPVAWFAFADNNGSVPLEFYGFDEKECKYAVLVNARETGWKGTVEGYLFQKGWTIQPVFTAPQPCPACDKLKADRDITANILNRVRYEVHLEAADLVIDEATAAALNAQIARIKDGAYSCIRMSDVQKLREALDAKLKESK